MPAATDQAVLISMLQVLNKRERILSWRRRTLHDTIDSLYLSAPLDEQQVALLERLEHQERDLSARRRKLHAQIDELRAQLALPRWRAMDTAA